MELNKILFECADYTPQKVNDVIAGIFANPPLSGLEFAAKKVFVKVNLLGAYPPARAITTHPALVEAVIRELKLRGATVYVGDSPGGFPKQMYMEEVFRVSGIEQAAENSGATMINLSAEQTVTKKLANRFVKELHLPRIIFEVDYLINLPKIKTHTLTLYTGAVKNLFGIIPGFYKSEIHKQAARAGELSEFLVDLHTLIPPTFNIADGITIMDGEGPSSGQPQRLRVILAHENAYLLDTVGSYLLGYDPEEILMLQTARVRGLVNISSQELLGTYPQLKEYRGQFKLPRFTLTRILMEQAAFLGGGAVKPMVKPEVCQLCSFCIESCPVKCISLKDKKIHFDYDECVRCLCCQELCPKQAIYLQRSLLGRTISRIYDAYKKTRKRYRS